MSEQGSSLSLALSLSSGVSVESRVCDGSDQKEDRRIVEEVEGEEGCARETLDHPVVELTAPARGNRELLHKNVQRFRGGLVFKAHSLLYHSTLGLRVIKKKRSVASRSRAVCREVGHWKMGNEQNGAVYIHF